jgi:tripartite-type tricarboxylate transporter receptor subunit TctC
MFAPKGTPQPIIDRLTAIVSEMANDKSIQKRMTDFGSVAVANSPDELSRMLREETAQWAKLVREIGLK